MTNPVINNLYGVAIGSANTNAFITHFDTRNPTANDVQYPVQKRWVNTASTEEWILTSFNSSGGVITSNWLLITGGMASTETLTGNSGGAVSPAGSGTIYTLGDTTTINVVGNPGSNTLTANVILPSTAHVVLIGETSSIAGVGPGTLGKPLISGGSGADPDYNTLGISGGGTNATSFTATNGIVTYNGTSLVNYSGPQISSTGIMTNTTQPCFLAALNGTASNVTGDSTLYQVQFDTTAFDQGSNLTSSSVFTAPVKGNYFFTANLALGGLTSGMTVGSILFILNSIGGAAGKGFNPGSQIAASGSTGFDFSAILPLDANDRVNVAVQINGGSKVVSIGGSGEFCQWSGYLIC